MAEVVSGVGKMSRRTDKNISRSTTQGAKEMPSQKYGERKMLNELQKSAPMQGAATRTPKLNFPQPTQGMSKVTPLFAETERSDEPATFGMPFGEGPGPEVLAIMPDQTRKVSDILAEIAQYDPTGEVNALYEDALLKGF